MKKRIYVTPVVHKGLVFEWQALELNVIQAFFHDWKAFTFWIALYNYLVTVDLLPLDEVIE